MNTLGPTLLDYELFIYTLQDGYASIRKSTLTVPHHKHTPPDVKHHRIPAPGLSFTRPNLPFLLQEIGRQLLQQPGT
jgi:hypothetical protein